MKKIIAVVAGLLLSISCFAKSFWSFNSGSSSIKYKYFTSATVINYSGQSITVNGEDVYNGSSRNFYSDNIIITSDSYKNVEAYYTIEFGKIIITIQ